MSYILQFSETALADIKKHKKAGDKAVLKKIETLLKELMEHPTTGTGQPEIHEGKHHVDFLFISSKRLSIISSTILMSSLVASFSS